MDEPPGLHSVKRRENRVRLQSCRSIGTSQTADRCCLCVAKTVSRRPSRNCRPVSAIRCTSAALNTTDEEPPASGMDSTADGAVPLVKSTRSPSALQLADPSGRDRPGVAALSRQGGRPTVRRELPALSSVVANRLATESRHLSRARQSPARRRVPPTSETSQPVHVVVSHAAARSRVPSPLQAYTSIPRVSAIALRLARVDDADLDARRIGIGEVLTIRRNLRGRHRKIRRVCGELRNGGLTWRGTWSPARRSDPPSGDRNSCQQHNAGRYEHERAT